MKLPTDFTAMLQGLLPTEWETLQAAISQGDASVSVRVNTLRGVEVPGDVHRVPWCPAGFYLDRRPPFTFDTDLHAGRYYVQDASSMFIHHVIQSLVTEPVRYLDLCAAPGGKTTAALSALPQGSLVVANEVVPARAKALADNVTRWGSPRAVVASSQPTAWGKMKHWFDVIAADVPCSGEGMMRKDDEAVAQWSPALVDQCAERQRAIIDEVWPALRPSGLLIYSTCTYNRRENEDMVEYIMRRHRAQSVAVPIEAGWNIHPAIRADFPAYRFFPHRTRGEGLFMAVLRKPDDEARADLRPRSGKTSRRVNVPRTVADWIAPAPMAWAQSGESLVAVPEQHSEVVNTLREAVRVIQAGVSVATPKGKNWIPQHALSQSLLLATNIPRVEMDYRTAIAYLHGEAIAVEAPRGYVAVTHRGAVLGWVNNLGNRANNLYPKGLRVLSSHIPEQEPLVVG